MNANKNQKHRTEKISQNKYSVKIDTKKAVGRGLPKVGAFRRRRKDGQHPNKKRNLRFSLRTLRLCEREGICREFARIDANGDQDRKGVKSLLLRVIL